MLRPPEAPRNTPRPLTESLMLPIDEVLSDLRDNQRRVGAAISALVEAHERHFDTLERDQEAVARAIEQQIRQERAFFFEARLIEPLLGSAIDELMQGHRALERDLGRFRACAPSDAGWQGSLEAVQVAFDDHARDVEGFCFFPASYLLRSAA